MNLGEIKAAVSKEAGITFKESDKIIDALLRVVMEALIDSDKVSLDPLGVFELQSFSVIVDHGEEKPQGRLLFYPNDDTLKFLIKGNFEMMRKEEEF